MQKLKLLSLNSLHLKIIGFVLTAAGAVGAAFFTREAQYLPRMILEMISYPAVAVYAFLLTEGFRNTQDLKRYAISLAAAAVVTEPFYDYACLGVWFDLESSNGQNFLFSLLFCLFVLILLRSINPESKWRIFMICSLIPAVFFWGFIINARFSILAALLVIIFTLLREKAVARDITAFAVGTVANYTGGLLVPLLRRYNGQRGAYPKYLFYGLYPALWAVLAIAKLLTA